MSRDEIAVIVAALGELAQVVQQADPADKADIYAKLWLTLTYQPEEKTVEAAIKPGLNMRKGFVSEGGLEHTNPRIFPDSALEYAGGGEIPCSGISCAHASGHAPARVKRARRLRPQGRGRRRPSPA
jgi:hypothetical protein